MRKHNRKLKVVISTKREFLPSIREGISEFIGSPKYDLRYTVSIKDLGDIEDPIIEIVITAVASAVVGAAVRSFLNWMQNRRNRQRGFGHVRYKTLDIARSEARYDLEDVQKIKDYEETEARVDGWNFRIVLRDNIGTIHSYLITKSCLLKSYRRS